MNTTTHESKKEESVFKRPMLYRTRDWICNRKVAPLNCETEVSSPKKNEKTAALFHYFEHEKNSLQDKLLNIMKFCEEKMKEEPHNEDWKKLYAMII